MKAPLFRSAVFLALFLCLAAAAEARHIRIGRVTGYDGLRPGRHHYNVPGKSFDGRVQRPAPFHPYSQEKSDRATVRAVQRALAQNGYRPGAHDGYVGPQTRRAIVAFQATEDLPVTGRVDGVLLSALGVRPAYVTR
jgi:N-acetyl-anhydromuramyl-L-alanine amidase AmpD